MPSRFYPYPKGGPGDDRVLLCLNAFSGIVIDFNLTDYLRGEDVTKGDVRGIEITASTAHVTKYDRYQRILKQELGEPIRLWGHGYSLAALQTPLDADALAGAIKRFLETTNKFKENREFKIANGVVFFMRHSHCMDFVDAATYGKIDLSVEPERLVGNGVFIVEDSGPRAPGVISLETYRRRAALRVARPGS